MSFCGSPNGKIIDPKEMKIFIHEFFDEEEQPSIAVGEDVRECLKKYSNKFRFMPLSEIITDKNKTEQLKKLLQIGKKRLPRLPQPTVLEREKSEEIFDPVSDKKIKDLTVNEILSTDGLAYIEQAIKLIEEKEKKTKGGTRRRRNKNTRRRRRRSTYRK